MRKILFIALLLIFGFGTATLVSAQTGREVSAPVQKGDDVELQAYPNPTKNILVLKTKDVSIKVKSVSFYNVLGTPVGNYTVNSNNSEINIEKLRPGKYLMKYTLSNQSQKVIQIIKQ